MANTMNFNVCENWGLRCYEQKVLDDKGLVILKCSMNRKDKETGEYTTPIYIDVICNLSSCDIKSDDYAKKFVNVWGQFSVSDYTNKNGTKVPTMSIFATKVELSIKK